MTPLLPNIGIGSSTIASRWTHTNATSRITGAVLKRAKTT